MMTTISTNLNINLHIKHYEYVDFCAFIKNVQSYPLAVELLAET